MLSRVIPLFLVLQMVSCFQSSGFRVVVGRATSMKTEVSDLLTKPLKFLAMGSLMFQLSGITSPSIVRADEAPASPETTATSSSSSSSIPKVPLLTKRSTDLQAYTDINRGFKMLRPFGFNEFDGAGGGYAVKFASLVDIDENVVVGSVPASDKKSVTDFGTVDQVAQKLATKRKGTVVSAAARETEGVVFYQFQFDNPLDPVLPRTGAKDKRPTRGVELYELCVAKGKLWSVQATSNDRLFQNSESKLRASLASFIPKL